MLVFALDLENVEEVERDRCGGDKVLSWGGGWVG